MKRVLSIFGTGLVMIIAPASTLAQVKDMSLAKKNLAAYSIVENAFATGDTSKINSVVASDYVDHTERGDLNRDSLKAMIIWMHRSFTDMRSEKISTTADDNYVMGLRRYTGTSDGSPGMPPKGDPYNMTSIEVVKFKNGKAVEHWVFMEMTEMMKMMGEISAGDKK